MRSIFWQCLIFSLCSVTAGCDFLRPNSEDLLKLGWAKQPKCPKEPTPLYCYETLGRTVCHSAPLDNQNRLSGYYGPKP
ncbi:hypothetical protein [Candidatus Paracaedibacter symbiosus]|uniref:hypothetical protein n=1 Tax=Candidatus Paracaedibacter symbiosus TaxID=244582 RepID=UPI0012EC72EC|nr:hypothetical protein [Candidatus Paracaedibacter symbiosus]